MLKSAFMALLLTVGSAAVAAAPAADPLIGTWQLNVAKSTFSPGPAPKSDTRTYAATEQGTAMTWKNVGAEQARRSSLSPRSRWVEKDYPLTGFANFDSISLKQVDDLTVQSTQKKKGGKVVGTTTRTVSKDGKVLTLKEQGHRRNGCRVRQRHGLRQEVIRARRAAPRLTGVELSDPGPCFLRQRRSASSPTASDPSTRVRERSVSRCAEHKAI